MRSITKRPNNGTVFHRLCPRLKMCHYDASRAPGESISFYCSTNSYLQGYVLLEHGHPRYNAIEAVLAWLGTMVVPRNGRLLLLWLFSIIDFTLTVFLATYGLQISCSRFMDSSIYECMQILGNSFLFTRSYMYHKDNVAPISTDSTQPSPSLHLPPPPPTHLHAAPDRQSITFFLSFLHTFY